MNGLRNERDRKRDGQGPRSAEMSILFSQVGSTAVEI